MSYPKPPNSMVRWNRDYSLYSATSSDHSEHSIGKAHKDLDRCAYLLNEMLDNGAGVLDCVKKRKSLASPQKENNKHAKKMQQSNRPNSQLKIGKIASSTPTTHVRSKRRRSLSVSSLSSLKINSKNRLQRHRSQSVNQVLKLSNNTQNTSARVTNVQPLCDSVTSLAGNVSLVSSEADTLTGVHLDNSSQFGIPPVFNSRGERLNSKKSRKLGQQSRRSRKQNFGWLKPQVSISTQTAVNEGVNKQTKLTKASKSASQSSERDDRLPCIQQSNAVSGSCYSTVQTGDNLSEKENDVDENYVNSQQNLIGKQQNQVEISRIGELCAGNLTETIQKLKESFHTADSAGFLKYIEILSNGVFTMFHQTTQAQKDIDVLLIPFQRETRLLKEEIQNLKFKLNERNKSQSLNALEDVAPAEKLNAQLSNQLEVEKKNLEHERTRVRELMKEMECYSQQSDDLKSQIKELKRLSHSQSEFDSAQFRPGSANQRLRTLQQSVRLFHTNLTDVASSCENATAKRLYPLLELCSQCLLTSMSEDVRAPLNLNDSVSNKVELPENLAEVVSNNLLKSRAGRLGEADKLKRHPDVESPVQVNSRQLRNSPEFTSRFSKDGFGLKTDHVSTVTKSHQAHTEVLKGKDVPTNVLPPTPVQQDAACFNAYIIPLSGGRKNIQLSSPQKDRYRRDKLSLSSNSERPTDRPTSSEYHGPLTRSSTTCSSFSTQHLADTADPSAQLHSTLLSDETISTLDHFNHDDLGSCSSSLSVATTVVDNAFQEGLAQLDANIARLQHSLKLSKLSFE